MVRTQLVLWFTIAVNLTTATVNCWLIYRNHQSRKRYREECGKAVEMAVREMAPAVAFCALMREAPGVPASIRDLAADAFPKGINVSIVTTVVPAQAGDFKVH